MDLKLTPARASKWNIVNIQNRVKSGLTNHPLDLKAARRSLAAKNDPRMISYIDDTPALKDPKVKKDFLEMLDNPENYWKLPNFTDELGKLVANAPANKYELNIPKQMFRNIKAYDAKNRKPGYSLFEDFSGSYGGSKAAALAKSKKAFDYIGKYSSKLSKIGKLETAGMDGYDFAEGNLIGGYNSDIFELKPRYKSPSKFDNYLNE